MPYRTLLNRKAKLFEPCRSVPVTSLNPNLPIRDVEEFAPAQRETTAGRGVSGKLPTNCAAEAPLNDGPLAIDENLFDLSITVGESPKNRGETVKHGVSSSDWLPEGNLDIRRVLVIKRGGSGGVMFVEGRYPLHHNLFWCHHRAFMQVVGRRVAR